MLTVDFSKLDLPAGAWVLDAGCGSGRHLSEAFRFKDVHVVGIDRSKTDAGKAKRLLDCMIHEAEDGGGIKLVSVSDITKLPFKDGSFDVVICSEVLEHIPDHRKAISEIIRVCKPGKSLVVSVPRYLPERICWALSHDYHNEEGGHIRIFRKKELIDLLENAGTRCIGMAWKHSLHSPYWWLKCMVGHKNDDHPCVKLYHRFLVWDIMKKPLITKALDKTLNPLISKSIVLYLKKGDPYGA
jgi:SAM-dependent methyltransferase